jgi:hypothetical protein
MHGADQLEIHVRRAFLEIAAAQAARLAQFLAQAFWQWFAEEAAPFVISAVLPRAFQMARAVLNESVRRMIGRATMKLLRLPETP